MRVSTLHVIQHLFVMMGMTAGYYHDIAEVHGILLAHRFLSISNMASLTRKNSIFLFRYRHDDGWHTAKFTAGREYRRNWPYEEKLHKNAPRSLLRSLHVTVPYLRSHIPLKQDGDIEKEAISRHMILRIARRHDNTACRNALKELPPSLLSVMLASWVLSPKRDATWGYIFKIFA